MKVSTLDSDAVQEIQFLTANQSIVVTFQQAILDCEPRATAFATSEYGTHSSVVGTHVMIMS